MKIFLPCFRNGDFECKIFRVELKNNQRSSEDHPERKINERENQKKQLNEVQLIIIKTSVYLSGTRRI